MSYRTLLDKECDVYRLQTRVAASQYGIPSADQGSEFYYDSTPTKVKVNCYLKELTNRVQINAPGVEFKRQFQIYFLPTEDIQVKDKILVDGEYYLVDSKPYVFKNKVQKAKVKLDG